MFSSARISRLASLVATRLATVAAMVVAAETVTCCIRAGLRSLKTAGKRDHNRILYYTVESRRPMKIYKPAECATLLA